MKNVLVTGATGQVGVELTQALRDKYGAEHVIAAGYNGRSPETWGQSQPYYRLDIRDAALLNKIIEQHQCDTIFHLAALLSAVAETKPLEAWDINVNGLLNVLETARIHHCTVFFRARSPLSARKHPSLIRRRILSSVLSLSTALPNSQANCCVITITIIMVSIHADCVIQA